MSCLGPTALLVCVLSAAACTARPPQRVVVIVVDTMRRDHLSVYGYGRDTSPFLKGLAASSIVFENAYSTSSWTAPATASIFTSLYPFQHGVVTGIMANQRLNDKGLKLDLNRIPDELDTLPEVMRRAGYTTFAVVENPNLCDEMGFHQGFDHFTNFVTARSADVITAELMRQKPAIEAAGRYFLYIHYLDPHTPYLEHPPLFDPSLTGDARKVSAYDSDIHFADDAIRQAYAAFGWDQNTLLLVTADHGEELGDHGGWGHADTLYAEVLNVPLLVRLPGGAKARRVLGPVSHVDILPTLAELVGLKPLATSSGRSLVPQLRGRASQAPPERALFAHLLRTDSHGRERVLTAVIRDGWKRIGRPEGPLLFDLVGDPGDQHDRSGERRDLNRGLKQAYLEFEARAAKFSATTRGVTVDPDAAENLRALGYVH